jgi:hypothetical protein
LYLAEIPIPRALLGADLFGPFGAKSKTAQHQNFSPRAGHLCGSIAERAIASMPFGSSHFFTFLVDPEEILRLNV